MSANPQPERILLWDQHPGALDAFAAVLRKLEFDVRVVTSAGDVEDALLATDSPDAPDLIIADFASLLSLGEVQASQLVPPISPRPLAVITDFKPEDYISSVRRLGIHHVLVKTPPYDERELKILVQCAMDPRRGFGLMCHFDETMEMYTLRLTDRAEKTAAIERVMNHFATNGYEIHELYDVRLILEELINNSFFHAFRNPDGSEKYSMATFERLEEHELVRIEFGHASNSIVGFSVVDNAGTLPPETVLYKLERQYSREGIFDTNGRGLYLSRMLASSILFNIEKGLRTQIVALFREKDSKQRLKPLTINVAMPRTFAPPDAPGAHPSAAPRGWTPSQTAPAPASAPPAPAATIPIDDPYKTLHEDLD